MALAGFSMVVRPGQAKAPAGTPSKPRIGTSSLMSAPPACARASVLWDTPASRAISMRVGGRPGRLIIPPAGTLSALSVGNDTGNENGAQDGRCVAKSGIEPSRHGLG